MRNCFIIIFSLLIQKYYNKTGGIYDPPTILFLCCWVFAIGFLSMSHSGGYYTYSFVGVKQWLCNQRLL